MHELSVAVSLVETVCEKLAGDPTARLHAIRLRVGPLSGVVPEALRFAFEVASAETPAADARLDIELVPAAIWCRTCAAEQEIDDVRDRRCPVCAAPAARLVRGDELELTALELSGP